jgi:insertion element IS1 protein InsB
MNCRYCQHVCIKKGMVKTIQRYRCQLCKRYQQNNYVYHRFDENDRLAITEHIRNGCGVRDMARLLKLAPSSVLKAIKRYAKQLTKPQLPEREQTYEMDEMTVAVASQKDVYLAYGMNIRTGKIIDFNVGARNKEMIGEVTAALLQLKPHRVYTDGLNLYPGLLGKEIHRANKLFTVHIERMNGTLRTHLKRLSKSGLSFSRSVEMLVACLKIYLWG